MRWRRAAPACSSACRRPGATVPLDVRPLVTAERVIRGSSYGSARTREDLPRLANLYLAGKLKVDQLITKPLRPGRGQRGVPCAGRRRAGARPDRVLEACARSCSRSSSAWPGRARAGIGEQTAGTQHGAEPDALHRARSATASAARIDADDGRHGGAGVAGGALRRRYVRRGWHDHLRRGRVGDLRDDRPRLGGAGAAGPAGWWAVWCGPSPVAPAHS